MASPDLMCTGCQSVFKTRKTLQAHERRSLCRPNNTQTVTEQDLRQCRVSGGGSFYLCPLCGKIYDKKDSFRFHLMTGVCQSKNACGEEHANHAILNQTFKTRDEAVEYIKSHELDAFFYKRSSAGANEYYRVRILFDRSMIGL